MNSRSKLDIKRYRNRTMKLIRQSFNKRVQQACRREFTTIIPTYHFQDSLPKLPIPSLEDTHKNFQYFSKPMFNSVDYEQLEKRSKEFFSSPQVREAQEAIISQDKSEYSSFISKPWYDMYLRDRRPLIINSNPHITFNDISFSEHPGISKQTKTAAEFILASLSFYLDLKNEKLEPDVFHTKAGTDKSKLYQYSSAFTPKKLAFYTSYLFGGYPLDMSQYDNLFASTRIPKQEKDTLVKSSNPKHIVVQHGSKFYSLQVLDENENIISKSSLMNQLEEILSSGEDSHKPSLGAFTTQDRDIWAANREKLIALDEKNKNSLGAIDSALFGLCLDSSSPDTYEKVSSTMLHGKGKNRWMDKSFQLIVTKNGKVSVNFEHSWGDGVAVLRYFNAVYQGLKNGGDGFEPSNQKSITISSLEQLEFNLNDDLLSCVRKAESEVTKFIDSLETATLESDLFSRSFSKEVGLGADGLLQMCFQLGWYKSVGGGDVLGATYESASTAAFKHGRTETIRSATSEALNFVKGFEDSSVSSSEKKLLLTKAVKNHGRITKNALMGKGMDRHLFALRTQAAESGLNGVAKEFFESEEMNTMNHWILSTSTLSSEALFTGGFGPVNDDCYGIAYGLDKNAFRCSATSYKKGSQGLIDSIEHAAKEMKDVLKQ
eukprot:maker-scaffold_8-snap-gene-6.12-mRNA-1 protein AED:0.02 eAED:0.02 QI:253/1/1/1/1/1/3/57/659